MPREGIPRNPAAWLTTAARKRAIDRLRRDLLRRLGRAGEAAAAYATALDLCTNKVERRYLQRRLGEAEAARR